MRTPARTGVAPYLGVTPVRVRVGEYLLSLRVRYRVAVGVVAASRAQRGRAAESDSGCVGDEVDDLARAETGAAVPPVSARYAAVGAAFVGVAEALESSCFIQSLFSFTPLHRPILACQFSLLAGERLEVDDGIGDMVSVVLQKLGGALEGPRAGSNLLAPWGAVIGVSTSELGRWDFHPRPGPGALRRETCEDERWLLVTLRRPARSARSPACGRLWVRPRRPLQSPRETLCRPTVARRLRGS